MSDSLTSPWIADYLINIAETYGCNLSTVPVHLKPGKKVQLLQFLTFPQFDEDDCIWAYISDKHQQIPVRFSQRAIAEYEKENSSDSQGKRLTEQHCAIATIKSFKPVFQRVPTGQVGKMSIFETLALNIDYIKVVGAAGESQFGSPRTLDTHNELNEWMEGLRAGGGNGNVLKLRKEKKLAQEHEEVSATGAPTSHGQRGYWSGQEIDAILSENHTARSEHKPKAEQDDWRESIAKKPFRFYRRPTGNGSTAPTPISPGLSRKNEHPASPVKRMFKSGIGALDLNSSPVITHDTNDDNPAQSGRQTTPLEWSPSPERSRIHLTQSYETVEELPISPPSTPPPLSAPERSQTVPDYSARVPEPAADLSPQASPARVRQTIPPELESTSLKSPVSPHSHQQNLPLLSSSPVLSSARVDTSSANRAASLLLDVLGFSVSHVRRVPVPSVKNTEEACGEILVPGSDLGGPVTQSLSNESGSLDGQGRAMTAASPGDDIASIMRMSFSPERVSNSHNGHWPILEPGPSQEPNDVELDDLSRMTLSSSHTEHFHGNGVDTRNRAGHNEVDPSPGHQQPYEPLPPSSPPIHSQPPSWQSSTVLAEETAAMEESPTHETATQTPTVTGKRTRSLSPSPMQTKRPRLVSREAVTPSHRMHGPKVFDAELLELGIEVDLSDYDDNPPPYPWGKGLSKLNIRPPNHPLLITNSKLGEIWKSVCKHRGWCEK